MDCALEPVREVDTNEAHQSVALWFLGLQNSEDCRAHYYRYFRSIFRPFAACNL